MSWGRWSCSNISVTITDHIVHTVEYQYHEIDLAELSQTIDEVADDTKRINCHASLSQYSKTKSSLSPTGGTG
jgi:hypothetical protein